MNEELLDDMSLLIFKNQLLCGEMNDLKEFYKDEYFVRVKDAGKFPETKHVAGSNFVDIGMVVDERLNRAVIVSAIDNIYKGAAGQAVQNMNLMFGLDEKTGIANAGFYL